MLAQSAKSLKGVSSIVLDLLRLSCSLLVLLVHSQAVWFPERLSDALPAQLSHGAVVIFFVLSGYVIAYTTSSGHRSAYQYALARLTRLSSIYFPAIAVTVICAIIINSANPAIYAGYDRGNNLFRYLISILYCNEIWFLSAAPGINLPIWSLGYEFWYYVLFGVSFYRFKGWKGWILPLVVAAFVGPKILAMMLIWIMGWAVFHLNKPRLRIDVSWMLVSLILIFSIGLMVYLPGMPNPLGTPKMFWGAAFITDWIVGIFVALAIWLLPTDVEPKLKDSKALKNVRMIANLTFPIYVLHFPLLVLAKCILPVSLSRELQWTFGGSLTLLVCVVLGLLFESYKNSWKEFFDKLLNIAVRLIKFGRYRLFKVSDG